MADDSNPMTAATESLKEFFAMQGEAMREMMSGQGIESLTPQGMDAGELAEWASVGRPKGRTTLAMSSRGWQVGHKEARCEPVKGRPQLTRVVRVVVSWTIS